MSLRVVGYTPEGRAIKVDEGPAAAELKGLGGGPIVSQPDWQRLAASAKRKSWRDSKARSKAKRDAA